MQISKTVKLWTFQSGKVVEVLKMKGILTCNWSRYLPSNPFTLAYLWMAAEMAKRNVPCNPYAPIWAWHSCGGYQEPPKLLDARMLLSDVQLMDGIWVFEFWCPQKLTLLSNYREWGNILDEFIDYGEETVIHKQMVKDLFDVPTKYISEDEAVQATLPYLRADWIVDIRPLKLHPDDFDFNPNEVV
ncbi:MAG TPA: DUF3841 domain-containing protein [Chitinophagales bacterium]|nr:DUF3841 domain-containing protein [Chitinophagales bacterium]